jgi:hypothetical protein
LQKNPVETLNDLGIDKNLANRAMLFSPSRPIDENDLFAINLFHLNIPDFWGRGSDAWP